MSSNDQPLDEATFRIKADDLDWDAMQRWIDEGVDPLDLDNLETPFGEAVGDLFDWSQINEAEDELAETVRQANLILQADLAVCRKLIADPSSGGQIQGQPEIEVAPDGLVTTRGPMEPTEEEYLTAHWRFTRLDRCGALEVGGIEV